MLCDTRGCKFMQQHGSRSQVEYEKSLGVVIGQGLEAAETPSALRTMMLDHAPYARWSMLVVIQGTVALHCHFRTTFANTKSCKDFGYHIRLQAVIRLFVWW